jgi:hypothetical protein
MLSDDIVELTCSEERARRAGAPWVGARPAQEEREPMKTKRTVRRLAAILAVVVLGGIGESLID